MSQKSTVASAAADRASSRSVIVVGIGASAGGLEVVGTFLTHLPADSGMAFVLVQHLDPSQPSLMAELLSKQTKMPVQMAADGMRVEPDHLYVIPPNVTLTMEGGILKTSTPAGHNTVRTHIDTFFRSLAADQGGHAVGVILSGAGSDGTMGLTAIKENGGVTIAQAPASAKFDSMPQSAIASGMVDFILPVEQIPAKLVEHAAYLEARAGTAATNAVDHEMAGHLPRICQILQHDTGHDFSGYKPGTMMRRIDRRMQVHHVDSIAAYVAALEHDPRESEQLLKDLLIGVTQFFRDPQAFEVLNREAIPKIIEGKSGDAGVRIWVPGCASGEEACSIAILVSEWMAKLKLSPLVQIFATDIDEGAIAAARLGQYPASLVEQLSPERRERFFIRHGDFYRISKQIRDMCIFSIHNLVRDPPFSVMDLISCRNLLIYMDSALQKRVVPLFHYALAPNGYLLLGCSEGLGSAAELFREVDAKHRLFQRANRAAPAAAVFPLALPSHLMGRFADPAARAQPPAPLDLDGIVGRMVMDYAPPCVVINERAEIVYSSGETSPWLQQPTGAPTLNLVDQARKGLRSGLRTAIRRALKTRQPAVHENLAVKTPGGLRAIDLIVRPLPGVDEASRLLAVIFHPAGGKPLTQAAQPAEESDVGRLELELHATHRELESTIEALKRSTEEATSSNEELLSMNEEMQSANEELQSSKEEMQSINEELSTVNTELSKKLEQLDGANADLQNLIRSTEIATLFLDRDLRIKRFTPAATLIFRLLDSDIGRPISDFAPPFAEGDLIAEMREVLQTLAVRQRQVYLPATRSWLLVRLLPSRTVANIIDGVVATFVDITVLKEAEDALRQSEERARQLTDTIPAIAWTARADGTMDFYNERISQYQGFEKRQDGTWEWRAALHPDDAQRTLQAWHGSVETGEPYQVEHRLRAADGQWRWHLSRAVAVRDEHGRILRWSGTAVDIDDLRSAQAARAGAETARDTAQTADHAKDEFLAVLSHELRTPLAPVVLALGMLQDDPRFDADTRASLKMIRRNVDLEARLIDDLLDVTRIAQGKIELDRQPVDLGTILHRAAEVCMPDILARHQEFAMDCPGRPFLVDGDAVRLQQVFWNLLRNAVKFTPEGGHVGVHCRRDDDDFITVEVSDSGEGIEPELLPRLFHAFEQGGEHMTRRFGGLGLGLSISKTLVTLHGGTVTVRSEGKGKGATFTVRLPLLPADTVPAPAAAAPTVTVQSSPSGPHRKLRILLVEDHGDTARMMRRLLSQDGYEVQAAADVATALGLMGDGPAEDFDLIISDLGLPDASGLDFMRAIRAKGLNLPAIALSGYGQEQDIEQSREAGFAEHLLKPVNLKKLHEAIARAVGDGTPVAGGGGGKCVRLAP